MRSITGASMMAAMIFSSPPQFGPCSRSMAKTRLSSRAQLRRAARWYAQAGSMDWERICLFASHVGATERLLESAIAYARTQFGPAWRLQHARSRNNSTILRNDSDGLGAGMLSSYAGEGTHLTYANCRARATVFASTFYC